MGSVVSKWILVKQPTSSAKVHLARLSCHFLFPGWVSLSCRQSRIDRAVPPPALQVINVLCTAPKYQLQDSRDSVMNVLVRTEASIVRLPVSLVR